MARDYLIQLADNSTQFVSGNTLKLGKGKKAVDVLGIRKTERRFATAYQIDHIPTGSCIADMFFYVSIARHVAQELLTLFDTKLLSDSKPNVAQLFTEQLFDYLLFMQQTAVQERMKDMEVKLTFEEYLNGLDYERAVSERISGTAFSGQGSVDESKLLSDYQTLGWVSSGDPSVEGMDGADCRAITEGRSLPSERFPNEETNC